MLPAPVQVDHHHVGLAARPPHGAEQVRGRGSRAAASPACAVRPSRRCWCSRGGDASAARKARSVPCTRTRYGVKARRGPGQRRRPRAGVTGSPQGVLQPDRAEVGAVVVGHRHHVDAGVGQDVEGPPARRGTSSGPRASRDPSGPSVPRSVIALSRLTMVTSASDRARRSARVRGGRPGAQPPGAGSGRRRRTRGSPRALVVATVVGRVWATDVVAAVSCDAWREAPASVQPTVTTPRDSPAATATTGRGVTSPPGGAGPRRPYPDESREGPPVP